jgi:hypothetical protein
LLQNRGAPLILVDGCDADALRPLLVGDVEIVEHDVYGVQKHRWRRRRGTRPHPGIELLLRNFQIAREGPLSAYDVGRLAEDSVVYRRLGHDLRIVIGRM